MSGKEAEPYRLDKRRIAAAFGAAARGYDAHAVLQRTVAERLNERLELFKLDPRLILDLGSGTGAGARNLARRYPRARVIALDIALPMLQECRRQAPRFFSRLRHVCADAERLPFAEAVFDLVYSNLTLQWCNDLDVVFGGLRSSLRPGALLLFSSFGPDTLTELRRSWAAVDDRPHVSAFLDMHDVGDALIRAGFSSPVMDVEHFTLTYASVEQLMRDLKGLGAHNAAQGRARGLTGRRQLKAMMEAYENFRRNGLLPATYEVVYGHAFVPEPGMRPQDGSTVAVPIARIGRRGRGTAPA